MVDQQPAASLTVLYIGEASSDEFRTVIHWLRLHSNLTWSRGVGDAERLLANGCDDPVLVVLAQSYPGQFSPVAIERLRRQIPLARLIHLVGAWCDGEIRSGQPLAGVTRVHWHDWRPRFEFEFECWRSGGCPTWGIAQSSSDEEQFAWQMKAVAGNRSKVVGIVTACGETARVLADMVDTTGFTPHLATGLESEFRGSLSLVVWDDTVAPRSKPVPLRQVVCSVAPAPVIALTSFARLPDVENALENGAVEVMTKPIQLADLAWLLQRHIPSAVANTATDAPAA